MLKVLPALLSPLFRMSDEVFEYENPTPTGESRKRRLATTRQKKQLDMIAFIIFCFSFCHTNISMKSISKISIAVISMERATSWQCLFEHALYKAD